MTTHAVVYEIQQNQAPSSLGIQPPTPIVWSADVDGSGSPPNGAGNWTSSPLPLPIIPPSGYDVEGGARYVTKVHGHMRYVGSTTGLPISTHIGDKRIDLPTYWNVGAVSEDNGVEGVRNVVNPAQGRMAPPSYLFFQSGAGAAIWGLGTPLSAEVHLEFGYTQENQYMGLSHFCEFQEEPPDGTNEGRAGLTALLDGFQNAGGRHLLGVNGSGQAIYANGCNFAAPAPEGAVYIRPEDFGNPDPDGIPDNLTNNTAGRFRFHPSVFIRRSQYIRGVSRPYHDQTPINQIAGIGQVFNIIAVVNPILQSNWLISIDGQHQLVQLIHPDGSDYRRPRDIWNNLWVPLIQGSQATANAVGFRQVLTAGFGGGPEITQLTNRLAFLDYARCLPIEGTPVSQVQAGPPPPP